MLDSLEESHLMDSIQHGHQKKEGTSILSVERILSILWRTWKRRMIQWQTLFHCKGDNRSDFNTECSGILNTRSLPQENWTFKFPCTGITSYKTGKKRAVLRIPHPNTILSHRYNMTTAFGNKRTKVGERPCSTLIEMRILLKNEAG